MPGGGTRAEKFLRHLEPLQRALEAYCRRSLRDSNSVLDALQNAVGSAYRDFQLYAEGTNFRAWIFRYLHHEILNCNRQFRRRRSKALPADVAAQNDWQVELHGPLEQALLDDPEAVLDQCDAELANAVEELPDVERAALLLLAIGEFKYREIAEILHVPVGTVMSSIARCRSRLRERLVRYGKERGLLKPE